VAAVVADEAVAVARQLQAERRDEHHPDEHVEREQRPDEHDRDAFHGQKEENQDGGRSGQPFVSVRATASQQGIVVEAPALTPPGSTL
jgi:hypothetical protein